MTIRYAKTTDIPQLVELAKKMANYHYTLDPGHYREASAYEHLDTYPNEWINDKKSIVVVAEEGNEIKGYCIAAIEDARDFMVPHIKKIGVIHGVFVDDTSRKLGIGRALVARAITWLEQKGACHIELTVDANNRESYAVWKKLGFADYKIKMRLTRND